VRRAAVLAGVLLLASPGSAARAPDDVSGQRAKRFIHRLVALGPRVAGSGAERRAAALVRRELDTLGYRVRIQRFALPRGGFSQNVVGLSRGPATAVVVAHLDGVSGTVAANDNGSGVAAMLEVARALRGRRGVVVAALGAEERHETGSSLHLGSARLMRGISAAGRRRIRVAISLDMVGVGWSFEARGLEGTPNRSARRVLSAARGLGIHAVYHQDTGQSDHAEMTRGGLPATWVEWRWDTCWHQRCDRPDRVSAAKLAVAARVAVAAVE